MRRQLAFAALALSSLIALAFVVPLAVLVRTLAQDRALTNAEHRAQTAVLAVLAGDGAPLDQAITALNTGDPTPVSVVLPDDRVLGAPTSVDADVRLARQRQAFNSQADGGIQVFQPVVDGDQVSVVRVFVPDDELRHGVYPAWVVLAGLGLSMVVIATAIADRIGNNIVVPVTALADTADHLSHGDLEARVEPAGPPEIREVGRTLNRLAGRIRELLDEERESAADMSHRLRTPMTALRLDVDALAPSEERERLVADLDALTRAVDRLITDARRPVRVGVGAATDLVEATADRVAFWAVLADEEDRIHTLVLPDGPCPVGVTRDDLDAVLDALLGNIFAHTDVRVGFDVEVAGPAATGAGGAAAGAATLVVADRGKGWPDGDVLGRGYSGGTSTGLGLDIVVRTATASGGSAELQAADGGGAQITVTFGPARE